MRDRPKAMYSGKGEVQSRAAVPRQAHKTRVAGEQMWQPYNYATLPQKRKVTGNKLHKYSLSHTAV